MNKLIQPPSIIPGFSFSRCLTNFDDFFSCLSTSFTIILKLILSDFYDDSSDITFVEELVNIFELLVLELSNSSIITCNLTIIPYSLYLTLTLLEKSSS